MCKNPAMSRSPRHRVALLALDGVVAFDLGTPPQVLGAARDEAGHRLYEVRVATPGARAGHLERGLHRGHRARARDAGVGRHRRGRRHRGRPHRPARSARRSSRRCAPRPVVAPGSSRSAPARSCSLRAGLLDGRPATTHWFWADRFRRMYPQVLLDADVLFVDDGDVLTSAGVAAGVDLCLHLVRQRPRCRGRQSRGPPLCRAAVAGRWAVAVHRAPRAGSAGRPRPRRPAPGRWPTSTSRSSWPSWPGGRR